MGFSLKSITKGAKGFLDDLTGASTADAVKKGIAAQTEATQQSNELLRYMYDTNRSDLKPRLDIQNNALAKLADFNPAEITSDPGYQFQLGQGNQAVERSAAARGLLGSGATLKSLKRFGQGLASQFAGQRFNQLAQLAGVGTDAVGMNAQNNQTYANNVSENLTNLANARASGYQASAAAGQQGVGNILNAGSFLFGRALSDRRLKKNVRLIGKHPSGLNLYAWTYLWGEDAIGVMADEAQITHPHAVIKRPDGYLMVDYGELA